MLRKIRITLAALFFIGINLLLLDISGVLHHYFAWMAKLQLLPAILSGSFLIVALLLLLTLLFGRIYCSVVCPLGVMQDCFSWIGGKAKKNRFHFTKEHKVLRYAALAVFVLLMVLGVNSVAAWVAPYSAYGRIATQLVRPVYLWGNNLLAFFAERLGSYAFYHVDVLIRGALSLVVAGVTFVLIGLLSFRYGRLWCNTICPVGTLLGVVSRFSLFRPVIDTSKCNGCTRCARNCKASCIDPDKHAIDASRCVACMDCLHNCTQGAISFRPIGWSRQQGEMKNGELDASRRKFVVTTAAVAASSVVMAQEKKIDGGLAVIEDKQVPERRTPIHPAGAASLRSFASHCTACQLCVAQCPNYVLRPSGKFSTLLQPEMGFERGYCRPDCTTCGDVCPAGAIRPFTLEQKASTSVGYAVVVLDNCIAASEGVSCGTCARHCPSGAIRMVPRDANASAADVAAVKIPTVDENRCLGCGACEYYCPSRPVSAIYIEGREEAVRF